MACASASPACTRPLSTTGRSLTLWSNARYTQPSPPCAMQPLISYWSATMSPGLSCGRKEYALPQCGHHPSDKRLAVGRRPADRAAAVPAEPLRLGHHRIGHQRFERILRSTRGISTRPPPRRRVGDSARVAVVCGPAVRCLRCRRTCPRSRRRSADGTPPGWPSGASSRASMSHPRLVETRPAGCPGAALVGVLRVVTSAISPNTSRPGAPAPGPAPLTTCGTTCSTCRRGGCAPACR